MNRSKPVSASVWLTAVLAAAGIQSGLAVLSPQTNDVYIAVCGKQQVHFEAGGWITNDAPVGWNEDLCTFYFCRTGGVRLLVPSGSRESIKFIGIDMRDQGGKELAKTPFGLSWGKAATPDAFIPSGMCPVDLVESPKPSFSTGTSGPSLPCPRELFEIPRSGTYYLTLSVRVMKQVTTSTNIWAWKPIDIPAITISVQRPKESVKP